MKVSSYADARSSEEEKGESDEEERDDWSEQGSDSSTSLSQECHDKSGRFSDESDDDQVLSKQPMQKPLLMEVYLH